MYTLELEGGRETKISCPVLSFAEPKPTKCQANVSTSKPRHNCLALSPMPSPCYIPTAGDLNKIRRGPDLH